jgi:hypothetical protein
LRRLTTKALRHEEERKRLTAKDAKSATFGRDENKNTNKH